MGYYVETEDSTAVLPAEHLDTAYAAMCKLNNDNELKRGGSFGRDIPEAPRFGAHPSRWFSWMDWNYPDTCPDAAAILEQIGFGTHFDDKGNLHIDWYSNKTGQEDLFLGAIAKYLTGYIVWRGEDGSVWRDTFDDGEIKSETGRLVFE